VRKPRRLPPEVLAPFVWAAPPRLHGKWGERPTDAGPPPEPIDWPVLYGNDNPVEVEVGFGKGLFLVTESAARPGTNFFGIEIIRKYQLYAAGRLASRNRTNVRTCSADAKLVLRDYVRPGSVEVVHVFFPDPWWKKRHEKRRLVTPEFVELVVRCLRPGGRLHFVTDVADYFEMVTGLIAAVPPLRPLPPPAESPGADDQDYLSNFERKFRREGRPIYRSLYEKG
jgi:tRNA (guanine-N7-)-methyltransferase